MECNRDEAVRAKSIAEGKFEQKDYAGAKKFVLKAQALYPGLEGLSQMITVLDVYISAENRIGGEVDWYGVLGVSPAADDDTLRRQYRKLALVLHPDKNKCAGADGAFRLLSEAWSLLSDKSKRIMYNQRRSSKPPVHSTAPSATTRANGFHSHPSRATSSSKPSSGTARAPPTFQAPPNPRNDTFWTICLRCKMQYEYLKVYLNHTLLCPNCRQAFPAKETPPPPFNKTSNSAPRSRHQSSSNHATTNVNNHATANVNQFCSPGNAASSKSSVPSMGGVGATNPSFAAKASNTVQQAQERMKREHQSSQSASGGVQNHAFNSDLKNDAQHKKMRFGENSNPFVSNPAHYADKGYGFPGRPSRPNSARELTVRETNKMLMAKAKNVIIQKLNEWSLETVPEAPCTKKEKVKEKQKPVEKSDKVLGVNTNGKSNPSSLNRVKNSNLSANDESEEDPAEAAMSVPDPDFHNFDMDRTESCFEGNEVWAAYDDDDGMPRFYALINKVVSLKPFKLRLSWLNSKTNTEFGPMEWVSSGFYKTCGEFRVGRYELSKTINSFSHKVKWSKDSRGVVHILPQKGQVWALYRNWSSDWTEQTSDEVIHKYDMVQVLDAYDVEKGVSVAPLVKVDGFKTVFHPHPDPEKVKPIPKHEMFRFSHQVPSHLLTGEEAHNSPKGYLELDPAATPLELLKTTSDANAMQNNGDIVNDSPQQSLETGTIGGLS